MRFPLAVTFLFFFYFGAGQTVKVIDGESKKPVVDAALYNTQKTTTAVTGFDGRVDISSFTATETIFVTHIAHNIKRTTKAAIIANGNILQLEPGESKLGEVVLSVAKFKQKTRQIPQKVIAISPEEIAFQNPQTSADLLAQSNAVFVQKSQLGGGSPMIRGFSTNRLLMAVDGVRMNTAIFRAGNIQNVINIDPLALSQTEVILGPGSVVYGSDAVGGAMNFYTLKPQFLAQAKKTWTGNVMTRYATANQEKTGHVDLNYSLEKWAFTTSVSYSDYDDLRMGSHGPDDYLRPEYVVRENGVDKIVENDDPKKQVPTGFDLLHLLQKVHYKPNETWDFGLGLIYSSTSDYARYDRLTRKRGDQLRAAEWYYGPQNWFFSHLEINKKGNGRLYDDAKASLAYQNFKESRHDRDFDSDILFETFENVDAYSANLDFTKKLNASQIFYGLEYLYNKVGSTGQQNNILTGAKNPDASRYPDGSTWQSLAAYASVQWELAKDLSLQTGLRYNHVRVDATFDDRFYDFPFTKAKISTGNLTGTAGINWRASPILGWRANLSTAFRAPNIDDVGKVFDSEPGAVVVPNPDLKAEYAYNYELGATFDFGESVHFDLAAYYTSLKNAFVRRDFSLDGQATIDYQGEPSRVQAIQNASEAKVVGLEAAMLVYFTKTLSLRSNLNIVTGSQEEDDGSRAPLRHAAPLFGNTHLTWQHRKLKLDAYADYNGQLNANDLAPSQVGNAYLYALDANGDPYSPRWHTLNFAAQYSLNEKFQVNATLENVMDRRYRPYSSGISAPGRNFVVGLRYAF